jgi:hypothetical protein
MLRALRVLDQLTWDGCSARDRSFTADGASRRSRVPRPAWLEATTCFFRERRGRRRGATFGGDRSGWFDSCRRRACSGEAGDRTNLFFLAADGDEADCRSRLPPSREDLLPSRADCQADGCDEDEFTAEHGGNLVVEFPVGQTSRRNKICTTT